MIDFLEKTLATEEIFNGNIINLKLKQVKLPNGKTATKEIVEHQGGVAVIPYQDEEVILIKQFRKAAEEVLYELPAGMLEKGEEAIECAKRELEEETGYKAKSFKQTHKFYTSPGFTNEVLYIYLATDLRKFEQEMDEHEFIELEKMPLKRIKEKLAAGEFKDAKTIIGLQYLLSSVEE